MKKLVCLLLAMLLVCSMAACGKEQNETNETQKNEGTTVTENNNPTTTESAVQVTTQVDNNKPSWRIPDHNIYINYPEDWITADQSGVFMVMQSKDCMVAVAYSKPDANGEDLMAAIAPTTTNVFNNVYSYCRGQVGSAVAEVKSSENCTVAGFDSLKFTGSFSNAGNYDCHIYGYTFYIDGVNLLICGLVSASAQDAQMIADINALTDQIAASLHTK